MSLQLGWVFEIWRKDREQRDKLQTLKGHVEAAAADDPAAIVESLVSQLVVNAQTYKVSSCHQAVFRMLPDPATLET